MPLHHFVKYMALSSFIVANGLEFCVILQKANDLSVNCIYSTCTAERSTCQCQVHHHCYVSVAASFPASADVVSASQALGWRCFVWNWTLAVHCTAAGLRCCHSPCHLMPTSPSLSSLVLSSLVSTTCDENCRPARKPCVHRGLRRSVWIQLAAESAHNKLNHIQQFQLI